MQNIGFDVVCFLCKPFILFPLQLISFSANDIICSLVYAQNAITAARSEAAEHGWWSSLLKQTCLQMCQLGLSTTRTQPLDWNQLIPTECTACTCLQKTFPFRKGKKKRKGAVRDLSIQNRPGARVLLKPLITHLTLSF